MSTCCNPPAGPSIRHLMELLVLIDAVKRASARRINVVIPYYGYGRKEPEETGRAFPSPPKWWRICSQWRGHSGSLRWICTPTRSRVFLIYLWIICLPPKYLIGDFRNFSGSDAVIVAPDAGGVERARAFAKRLNADLAIIDQRYGALQKERAWRIVGDVKGRTVVIVDDMIDTGKTLLRAAVAAEASGATAVHAYCVHAILSGDAVKKLNDSPICVLDRNR